MTKIPGEWGSSIAHFSLPDITGCIGTDQSINQSINEIYIVPWSKNKICTKALHKKAQKYNNTRKSKDEIQLLVIHKFKQMVFQESLEDVYWSSAFDMFG